MRIDGKFLINLAAFQLGWFACVWGGANQMPALGAVAVAVIIAIHLLYTAHQPLPELYLIGLAGLIGAVWDGALVTLGWLNYPSGNYANGFAPYWIVALWMLFATTLNVSMGWLKNRAMLGVLMGAIGGPLAYYAGFKLGGVKFSSMPLGLGAQAAGWALLMPLLSALGDRFNGMRPAADPCLMAAGKQA